MEKQIGKTPIELIGPEFPEVMVKVWSAFFDLTGSRSIGPSGPNAIPYTEIKAYIELSGAKMSPLEIAALKRLDSTYLRVAYND